MLVIIDKFSCFNEFMGQAGRAETIYGPGPSEKVGPLPSLDSISNHADNYLLPYLILEITIQVEIVQNVFKI